MTASALARRTLSRVLRGRCPACGEGKLRKQGLQYHESCSSCGIPYVRDPVDLGMFMYVSTAAITGIFVMGYFLIGFPTTLAYRVAVGVGALALMAGTAPIRRFLGIGFMYVTHVWFDEEDAKK